MKKLLPLLMLMLTLTFVLAACNDDKKETGNADAEAPKEEQVSTDETTEVSGEIVDPTSVDNEFFKTVETLLKEKGYDVGELKATDHGFFGAKQAVAMEIDGEDMLPLQIYDLDPADENLVKAKETGMGMATFEGEQGEIPVLAIDHYYFFLGEGHPAQKDIYKLLEETYK
ncbi:hypothetical protein [Psychrobacillus sp. L4]|uniref:hypothetical protein n=1 Tax=Psychrobacillus sp. L4 TaxID=3236892 RepID=UPI0036F1C0CA